VVTAGATTAAASRLNTNGDQALAYFSESRCVYHVLGDTEPVAANAANADAAAGPPGGQLALPEGC